MNLQCPYCGEQIVSRGVGKCPGCYKDLPEELQLTQREKEFDQLEEDFERRRKEIFEGIGRHNNNPLYIWTSY